MPKNHARSARLKQLKVDLGVKHHDAIAILGDERYELICDLIDEYADVNTYAQAVTVIETSPSFQILCEDCGWTMNMVCPECPKGCGCETRCSGWRHSEYRDDDDEPEDYGCRECGAGGSGDPYGECDCYDDDQPARAEASAEDEYEVEYGDEDDREPDPEDYYASLGEEVNA